MAEVKEMALEIQVDDGIRKVPIKNMEGEEIGVFYFRPTDVGIIDRYNRMIDKFDTITEPLEGVSIASDGTADELATDEEIKALHESEKRLYDVLNEMFGGNMAEAFFGKMNPFSPVNGNFYCENAIEAVGKFISAQFDAETKRMSKKVNKYTQDYKKGRRK
ncbi:MAG: hypothetical protein LIP12_00265 [Clostridiales bacterium]|nr:hypothetical protein [Clostridiales bacterium]